MHARCESFSKKGLLLPAGNTRTCDFKSRRRRASIAAMAWSAARPAHIATAWVMLWIATGCSEYKSSEDRLPDMQPVLQASPGGTVVTPPIAYDRGSDEPSSTRSPGESTPALRGVAAEAGGDASTPPSSGDAGTPPSSSDASAPATLDGGDAARCAGDILSGDHCYHISEPALAWSEARDACRAGLGELVTIDDASEDAFVATLVDADVWIGANDQLEEGQFTWADGSPLVFTHWGANQPDGVDAQDCVVKRQEANEPWYDQPCADAHDFVCERPVEAR
jgi:hypothetical protein